MNNHALRECIMLAVSAQESALAAHTHAGSKAEPHLCRHRWVEHHVIFDICQIWIRESKRLSVWTAWSLLNRGVWPSDTHDLRVRREFREILGAPGCGEENRVGHICTILYYTA